METNQGELQYPVLLVHGMGFRDNDFVNYWGRIPKELEKCGCTVYYGMQDSNASIETNGDYIAKRIEEILVESGAKKVNIIAHSKGGLDSRYAISTAGVGDKVASLTTLATPHHGSKTVDALMQFPQPLVKFVGACADFWCRLLGDKKPNSYAVFRSFTTEKAADFNAKTPDDPAVFYQSYAFVMKHCFSDMLMWLPNLVVSVVEGENDGLLTPESVKWGDFKGTLRSNGRRGISHCDEIDLRRRPLCESAGDGISDIVDVYKNIICDLRAHGF